MEKHVKSMHVDGGDKIIHKCGFCGQIFTLKVNLTQVPEMHSHLESMEDIPIATLDKQITFSYMSFLMKVLYIFFFTVLG